jgi:hypothetical protein
MDTVVIDRFPDINEINLYRNQKTVMVGILTLIDAIG